MIKLNNFLKMCFLLTFGVLLILGSGPDPEPTPELDPNAALLTPSPVSLDVSSLDSGSFSVALANGETLSISGIAESAENEGFYKSEGQAVGETSSFTVSGDIIFGSINKGNKIFLIETIKGVRYLRLKSKTSVANDVFSPSISSQLRNQDVSISDQYELRDGAPEMKVLFVTLLALFNEADEQEHITAAKHSLNQTNEAFSNSGINAKVTFAGLEVLDLPEFTVGSLQDVFNVMDRGLPASLSSLRDSYEADLVAISRKGDGNNSWEGRAGISVQSTTDYGLRGFPRSGYSLYDVGKNTISDPELVMHELGHNFGCHHDKETRRFDNVVNWFSYANGYNDDLLCTLMSYCYGDVDVKMTTHYSSPDIYHKGNITGIAGDNEDAADCARFVNLSAPVISRFRPVNLSANDDAYSINNDSDLSVNVTDNDSSSDGASLNVNWNSVSAANGALDLGNDGSVTYTPDSDFVGTVTASYQLTDDIGNESQGNLVIEVKANNIPPTLASSSVTPQAIDSLDSVTFASTWTGPENKFTVGVKARYRMQGTTDWYEKNLQAVSADNTTFSGSTQIIGAGIYEYQFRASNANEVNGSPVNTSDWLTVTSGTFSVGEPNFPPTSRGGNVSPFMIFSGEAVVIGITLDDPEEKSIVDVKTRYRKKGTSTWTEVPMSNVENPVTDYRFESASTVVTGDVGSYEVQFQASDADTPNGVRTNTTEWQEGGGFFTIAKDGGLPQCGTIDGKVYPLSASSYGDDTFCESGKYSSPAFPSAGGTVSWSCYDNSNNTASCSASHAGSPSDVITASCNSFGGGRGESNTVTDFMAHEFCTSGTLTNLSYQSFNEEIYSTSYSCQSTNAGGGGCNGGGAGRAGVSCGRAHGVVFSASDTSFDDAPASDSFTRDDGKSPLCSDFSLPETNVVFPEKGETVNWSCSNEDIHEDKYADCEAVIVDGAVTSWSCGDGSNIDIRRLTAGCSASRSE